MIVVITGPSGAGKTTVSEKLAKALGNYVNIDVDHLKHMNPNAFAKVLTDEGEEDWPYSAWELLGENTALLANNFLAHGYDVIINGYLEVEAWKEISKHVEIDLKILLLPDEKTNISRDQGRNEEVKMGENAVKRGRKTFIEDSFYNDFNKLDTSDETEEDTVEKIKGLIG